MHIFYVNESFFEGVNKIIYSNWRDQTIYQSTFNKKIILWTKKKKQILQKIENEFRWAVSKIIQKDE